MAIFAFIFGGLSGILTALLAMMLFDVGLIGGIGVFYVTCYLVALPPLVHRAFAPRKPVTARA